MKPIRVMIIEDSRVTREMLAHIVRSDARLAVADSCESAEAAFACLDRVRPDVITMDVQLPGMNGLEATRRIMETNPTPIVIVSGRIRVGKGNHLMEALRNGALSVIEKPTGLASTELTTKAAQLCKQLVLMSQIKVIRQRFNGALNASNSQMPTRGRPVTLGQTSRLGCEMIGIVASTGGPRALEILLRDLEPDFPIPIALVQHVTPSFHQHFVDWLDQICPLHVCTPKQGEVPQPGVVYVAPADAHLCLSGGRFALHFGAAVCGQRPSGTELLRSMASDLRERCLGVVLTGMGSDGAEGLLAMRQHGALTIAEDPSTSVVDGMPGSARELNAVDYSLPIHRIAAVLRDAAYQGRELCR